jgi:glucose-1-phosphate thymidylyltransferase
VNAIVLAAGYATRLRPLTDTVAKPLLPVGGRPMVDYLYDKVAAIEGLEGLHVVTNARFAQGFRDWAAGKRGHGLSVAVHDDGTTSNEDRLGAIGDIQFTVERAALAGDDLLVVAGDNLFDFSLSDYVAWWRGKEDGSSIAVYSCPDPELVKQYSVVELDEDERVTSFVEKPQAPKSSLAAIATYIFRREHAALIPEYLREDNSPDQPGNLVAWLYRRVPVYGYRFPGEWLDIGDRRQLLDADNRMRERRGLPARDEYALSED